MLKTSLFFVFFAFLILLMPLVSGYDFSSSVIKGKAIASRQVDDSNLLNPISSSENPGLVKILVYADYSYNLPQVLSIDSSNYIKKINSGINPNIKDDVNLEFNRSRNMYDYWATLLDAPGYSSDKSKPFLFGTGFLVTRDGYILTTKNLVHPDKDFFQTIFRINLLETLESSINSKNVGKNYSTYRDYIDDVALYTFLGSNLNLDISNFKISVIYNGKEYLPSIIYYDQALGFSLLKIQGADFPHLNASSKDAQGNLFLLGYPSSHQVEQSDYFSNNYPVFLKNSRINKNLASFSNLDSISEGESGAPILDSSGNLIYMASYNYPGTPDGYSNSLLPMDKILDKIQPYIQAPSSDIKAQKTSPMNNLWKILGIILIIFLFIIALIFAMLYFKSRRPPSDRILIITQPKPPVPSLFSANYPNQQQVLGRIRTYS